VRSAATGLIRTLRGLTLRLADPQHTPQSEAAAAVAITLPFLVESGAFRQIQTYETYGDQARWSLCVTKLFLCRSVDSLLL